MSIDNGNFNKEDNFFSNNSNILIIPTEQNKPVKIVFENDCHMKNEKYTMTMYDVLKNELRWNYNLRKNLTRQQIHSERGKLRKGRYTEVINFLSNRGISRDYINNEATKERERVVFTQSQCVNLVDLVDLVSAY